MKILFATSECAPFSKSGGLADVAFSLPPALQEAGHQLAIITPLYRCVRDRFGDQIEFVKEITVELGWRRLYCGVWRGDRAGVTTWFVENDDFFDRDRLYGYDDDKLRFAFFSRAIIELLDKLDFLPDVLHCNDWETAPAVIYLKNDQAWRHELQGIKSVYTIHNIAYQGQFGISDLESTFALPAGWYEGGLAYEFEGRHDINFMKGAMMMANAVSTVSATYARELHFPYFAQGLQGVVDMVQNKLRGILNGIDMDHYDPMLDKRIAAPFSVQDMSGKAVCKASIQEKFGLAKEAEAPLLVSVARLVEQKGIELIKEILPRLMEMGVQLIVYGQGDPQYLDYFAWAKTQWPGQLGFSSDYNEQLAAEVFSGADFYLMPSRFEPCGLSQMMAMRYGTIPIVHETGGLKDSVRAYSDFDGIGDGFSFSDYSGQALFLAILAGVRLYFGNPKMFRVLQERCMTKDFSWAKSAEQYSRMYEAIADSSDGEPITFSEAYEQLKAVYEQIAEERKDEIPADYHRVIQVHIVGRGDGVFTLEFKDGTINVLPNFDLKPDASIAASLDNLLGMAKGTVSSNKLFLSGQLKVSGSIVKGAEMRRLLKLKTK